MSSDDPFSGTGTGLTPEEADELRRACEVVVRRVPGGEAFELIDLLGRGGFGAVFRARWALTGTVVALKICYEEDPAKVRFLRREFRHIARRYHPNVAPVYELRSDDRGAFLVMPVIQGKHLDQYVRVGPFAERLERLRGVIGGLLDGLAALHEWGLVHGDIKPENLLASPQGAVLLDYNLTTGKVENAGQLEGGDTRFIDPLSLHASAAGPATDIYSLGAVCYAVLADKLPHGSTSRKRDDATYRPLDQLVPEAPRWLVDVLAGMLRADPAARLTLPEVAAAWGVPARPQVEPAGGRFLGRSDELRALRRWFDGRTGVRVLHLHGGSGLGKSSLVQEFERTLHASQTVPGAEVVMLRGVCERSGSAAFDAFEAVVDQLIMRSYLSAEVEAALSTQAVAVAVALFPALAERGVMLKGDPLAGLVGDDLRTARVGALRSILTEVARKQRVMICLDDMQWARGDSQSLLAELVDGEDPPDVAWLLVSRDEDTASVPWRPSLQAHVHELSLAPMSSDDLRTLWEASRPDLPVPKPEVLDSFGGSPFVLSICARFALQGAALVRPDLAMNVISDAVTQLDSESALLVKVASVLGFAVSIPELLSVAGLTLAALPTVLNLDAARWLVVDERAGRGSIRISHDIVARSVVSAMPEGERVGWHQSIYDGLRQGGAAAAARLYPHALAAGRTADLGALAVQAAADAERATQFLTADEWYQRAAQHGGGGLAPEVLASRRAYALSCVGRSSQAAELYVQAAELAGVDSDAAFDWRVHAVVSRYQASDYAAGHALVRELLTPLGVKVPATEKEAITASSLQRLRLLLFGWRPTKLTTEVSVNDRRFLEATHRTFAYLSATQFALADAMIVTAFRRALKCGSIESVMTGLTYEAMVLTSVASLARPIGLDRWLTREAGRMLDEARRIAGDNRYYHAAADLAEASRCWSIGEWHRCAALGDRARDGLVASNADSRHEIASAVLYRMTGLWWSGELATLAAEHVGAWQDANLRRQTYHIDTLRLGDCAVAWLMSDDPARLLREGDDAEKSWVDAPVNSMAFQRLLGVVRARLYLDQPEVAWSEIERVWPHMETGTYTGMVMTGLALWLARGTTAAALAVRQPQQARRWLREVDRSVKEIERKRTNRNAQHFASVVAVCGLAARGRRDEAHVALARLAGALGEADLKGYAAAARAVHPAHRERGLDALRAMGVARPDRFAVMMFPSFSVDG